MTRLYFNCERLYYHVRYLSGQNRKLRHALERVSAGQIDSSEFMKIASEIAYEVDDFIDEYISEYTGAERAWQGFDDTDDAEAAD